MSWFPEPLMNLMLLSHTDKLPECGGFLTNSGNFVKYEDKKVKGGRSKRYSIMKHKWHHLNLTYRIGIYSRTINRRDLNYAVALALKVPKL